MLIKQNTKFEKDDRVMGYINTTENVCSTPTFEVMPEPQLPHPFPDVIPNVIPEDYDEEDNEI